MDRGTKPGVDWNIIMETLPVDLTGEGMETRREMWDLINVDDRERLTADQLETGIATVTRSDDFFDCHPAVQTAFKFTKLVTNRGVTKSEKDQVKEGEKKLKTIVFDEFRTFLSILRQYYIYCQMFGNNEVDLQMKVSPSSCEEVKTAEHLEGLGDGNYKEMEFGKIIHFLITKFVEKEYEMIIT